MISFYPPSVEHPSIDLINSVDKLLLAMAIIQTILLLFPASQIIIEWRHEIVLLGIGLLAVVFLLLPIYSAVIAFRPIEGTIISLLGDKVYLIVMFVGGTIAVIGFLILIFSLLAVVELFSFVYIGFLIGIAVASITTFLYLRNPMNNRSYYNLVGLEKKVCLYAVTPENNCVSISHGQYINDMYMPLMVFAIPYIIVFAVGLIYLICLFCSSCGEAVMETVSDWASNSIQYTITNSEGKVIEEGYTGLWGRQATYKE